MRRMMFLLIAIIVFSSTMILAQNMEAKYAEAPGTSGVYINMGVHANSDGVNYYQKGSIYLYRLNGFYWVIGLELGSGDIASMYYYGAYDHFVSPNGTFLNSYGGLVASGHGANIVETAALPVELTTFNASVTDNNILLKWETATEVNNYGFEIERKLQELSINTQDEKQNWNTIGFMEGHGNSNSPKHYSFSDNTLNLSGNYSYRLKQLDIDGSYEYSKIIEVEVSTPTIFTLSQNYPNPFNPNTTIKYQIPEQVNSENVFLKIYNTQGKEVVTLVNQVQHPGNYQVNFDGSELSSGMYFYKLQIGNFVNVKKMLLLK